MVTKINKKITEIKTGYQSDEMQVRKYPKLCHLQFLLFVFAGRIELNDFYVREGVFSFNIMLMI